ncbi:ABC transporter permease [Escherichia coli]|uniref:ABC transporter permease n=1 Tax=Escherichia coli TaxID=562 RepID=A0A377D3T4_ECOLX|nr:ABC transporter permease [Escherichia coli]
MMLSEETSAVRPPKQTRFNGAKLVWMLKGSPLTVTGAVIIVLMLLMMIFSPWLATHDPNAIDLTARLLPPSAAHWFWAPMKWDAICLAAYWSAVSNQFSPDSGSRHCRYDGVATRVSIRCAWRTRRRDYHAHHGHYAVDSFAGADNGTGSRSRAEFV